MSKVAFITGGSSNLGISLCKRLIDNLQDDHIKLVITSRTLPKAIDSIDLIKAYAISKGKSMQVEFDYILVDFSNMVSVLAAYYELNKNFSRIDYVFLNSVQTCYDGIDWAFAIKDVLKNPVNAVTEAQMKIQKVGLKSADDMGLLFQGNVFGPYYLIHRIKHLIKGGKIIWVSSEISGSKFLSFNDLQLLENKFPYEGSKRLIDLVHMGSYKALKRDHDISLYVVNPGIFTSFGFYEYLNFVTFYGMLMLFYIARFLGSTIHNISGYTSANALVSCALKDEIQQKKVVSSTNIKGEEYLEYVEIDPTGAEDVVAYLEKLCNDWDINFKDQIVDTRLP